jgi:hypothetical protein
MIAQGRIEDLIAPLKQRMEALEKENQALRERLAQAQREIADLHRGVGITLLIDGKPVFGVPGMGNTPLSERPQPLANPTPPLGTPAVANRAAIAQMSVQPAIGGSLFPERMRTPTGTGSNPPGTQDAQPAAPERRRTGYTDFFME